MCVRVEKGAETREVGSISAPVRQPGGGERPASQPERLGNVCVRVLERLIVQRKVRPFTNA